MIIEDHFEIHFSDFDKRNIKNVEDLEFFTSKIIWEKEYKEIQSGKTQADVKFNKRIEDLDIFCNINSNLNSVNFNGEDKRFKR